MKKFKLKKEARQFFDKDYHKEINSFEFWETLKIPLPLLDEVESVYIDYGHCDKNPNGSTTRLASWQSDGKSAQYRFTVHVQDINLTEYASVNISELMDEMQKVVKGFLIHTGALASN